MLAYIDPATTRPKRDEIISELLLKFSDYIRRIAGRRWKQFRCIHGADGFEDIVGAGRLGFIFAVERWQPSWEKPLSYFASKWITYSCLSEALFLIGGSIAHPVRISRLIETYKTIRDSQGLAKAEKKLLHSKCRESTRQLVREIASTQGAWIVSLDHSISNSIREGHTVQLHDIIPDPVAGIQSVEVNSIMNDVRSFLLTRCNLRERYIMNSLHPVSSHDYTDDGFSRDDQTYAQVGLQLGISRERVRQLYEDIKCRLRTHLCHGADA